MTSTLEIRWKWSNVFTFRREMNFIPKLLIKYEYRIKTVFRHSVFQKLYLSHSQGDSSTKGDQGMHRTQSEKRPGLMGTGVTSLIHLFLSLSGALVSYLSTSLCFPYRPLLWVFQFLLRSWLDLDSDFVDADREKMKRGRFLNTSD